MSIGQRVLALQMRIGVVIDISRQRVRCCFCLLVELMAVHHVARQEEWFWEGKDAALLRHILTSVQKQAFVSKDGRKRGGRRNLLLFPVFRPQNQDWSVF